jgi:hypothetical protein
MAVLFVARALPFPGENGGSQRRRNAVLRITKVAESPSEVTLKLEGRIVSDWVDLVERECVTWLRERPKVRLDFAEVTFVEPSGVEMLQRLAANHVQLINCPPLIAALLQRGEEPRHNPEGHS